MPISANYFILSCTGSKGYSNFRYYTVNLGQAAFTIWIYLIYMTFPGIFAMLPMKSAEVFGDRFAGAAIGCYALTDIGTAIILRIVSSNVLTGLQSDYFTYFVIAACCGPLIGFILTMFFPPTKQDEIRLDNLKNCYRNNDNEGHTSNIREDSQELEMVK